MQKMIKNLLVTIWTKTTLTTIVPIVVTLFSLAGCSQPVQESLAAAGAEETKISFNLNVTGLFSGSAARSGEIYQAKMLVTDLATNVVKEHDWTISIIRYNMAVKSYNTINLTPGNYSFELLTARGGYNYHAKSNPIYIKSGDNLIDLTLTPVIGDFISTTTGSSMLDSMSNLVYHFSTVQLSMLADPRLGYSINGSPEVIISLNKQTGLAPVKVNLPTGVYPINLNFYEGNSLIGSNSKDRELSISSAFDSASVALYPIAGTTNFTVEMATGETEVSIRVPKAVIDAAAAKKVHRTVAEVTMHYPDGSTTDRLFMRSDTSGDRVIEGKLTGLNHGRGTLIIDIIGQTYSGYYDSNVQEYLIARSITENVKVGDKKSTFETHYKITGANTVESPLMANLKLSIKNIYSDPVDGLYYSIDNSEAQKIYNGQLDIMVESGDKTVELRNGFDTIKTFKFRLKPFETKEINYTVPKSLTWNYLNRADGIIDGAPLPFDLVKNSYYTYRVRVLKTKGIRRLVAEKLNKTDNTWESNPAKFPLAYYEFYRGKAFLDNNSNLVVAVHGPEDTFKQREIRRIMRYNRASLSWEELTIPTGFKPIYFFRDLQNNIYIGTKKVIKRLNTLEGGWVDYPLPIREELKNNYSFMGNIELPLSKLIFADTRYRTESWCRYDPATQMMQEFSSYTNDNSYASPLQLVDQYGSAYAVQYEKSITSGPGGSPNNNYAEYSLYVIKGEPGKPATNAQWLMTTVRRSPVRVVQMASYHKELYLCYQIENKISPSLAKTTIEGLLDQEINKDLPIIGSGYKAAIHISADKRVYLYYYNENNGKAYYFERR